MPVFLDTTAADFDTAFAALLNAKREDSPDVDAIVAGEAELRVNIGISAKPLRYYVDFGRPRLKLKVAHKMYLLCYHKTAENLGMLTGFAAEKIEL